MSKNYERKKCRTEVQQQSTTDSPQTLRVSIPLESFTAARVTSVFELSSRLKVASELPGNWMNMTNSSAEASNICLCYLTQRPPLHYSEVQYIIQIDQSLLWTLSVFSVNITIERCSMLASISRTMDCVDHVIQLVKKINEAVICVGNPDQQFVNLDFSGNHPSFCIYKICVYYVYLLQVKL